MPDRRSPRSQHPGLYLHIPFCSAICPYCDFAVRRGQRHRVKPFVAALEREIRGIRSGELLPEAQDLANLFSELANTPFDTLYLGGGTPTYLGLDALETLFGTIFDALPMADGCRIFLEANPEDVNADSLAGWRRLGVRTLSLGVQSLDSAALKFLGRRHGAEDARRTVELAKEAGFETVSVDLIYGLKNQNAEAWRRTLEQALLLDMDHLSLYELEIHPRTDFGKRQAAGEPMELHSDDQADLFLLTHRVLADAGWDGYEVSNFARGPEHRSLHNQKHWHHVPYLGLGPSAHSYMGGWRCWNEPLEPRWRQHLDDHQSPVAGWEKLPESALDLERVMLGLRLADGVNLAGLRSLTAEDFLSLNKNALDRWQRQGLIRLDQSRIIPSISGMAVADSLATELQLTS